MLRRLSVAAAGTIATAGTMLILMSVLHPLNRTSVQKFHRLYVFGDSLSDIGNTFRATGGETPPSPPYFQGRFSNGSIWVEYLASKLGLSANPGTNFAFGGATTGKFQGRIPGLLTQIQTFTETHPSAPPDALYVIWAGANDYLHGASDPTVPVHNLVMAVKSLATVGAKNIIVVNLPDLGKIPATRKTARSSLLNDLTERHNTQLAAALNALHQKLNGVNIIYLDVDSQLNQVIKTPKKFGFKNVTQSCLSKMGICKQPNEYLFWDGLHPTTVAHKLLVELTFSKLNTP